MQACFLVAKIDGSFRGIKLRQDPKARIRAKFFPQKEQTASEDLKKRSSIKLGSHSGLPPVSWA